MEIDDIRAMLTHLTRDARILRDALHEVGVTDGLEEGLLDLEDALNKLDDELQLEDA